MQIISISVLQHAFAFLRKLEYYVNNIDYSAKEPEKFFLGKKAL
jgi:hypothetical protein